VDRQVSIPELTPPIVVVAKGLPPNHPVPLSIIHEASTRIAVDGGAQILHDLGYQPDLILGDMDSAESDLSSPIITLSDQSHTDLDKALTWCVDQGLDTLHLIAAFGERDDHSLTNYLLLLEFMDRLAITAYSDHFQIQALKGRQQFKSQPGQQVSLIALGKTTKLTTTGLKYPLENEPLSGISRGVSNEATGLSFEVEAHPHPILVFRAY